MKVGGEAEGGAKAPFTLWILLLGYLTCLLWG